jgi:hypothetical protein
MCGHIGAYMAAYYKPPKEVIRKWQEERIKEHKPIPDMKQIRRELGWDLIEAERESNKNTLK